MGALSLRAQNPLAPTLRRRIAILPREGGGNQSFPARNLRRRASPLYHRGSSNPPRCPVPLDIVPSVCPHDCPSTCALEVERIDPRTIGRIHGARDNSYTAGVVCAKVGRYAERQHHPDRLAVPLRRIAAKGTGRSGYEEITWEAALDEVADAFLRAAQCHGSEAVWPYF
ncbi:MAG: hypothetical protein JO010_02620, partial [Alphaproteobacteria bacterium]|nr:hypothetical protein [Alphaproteobacteria bacterium]